MLYVKCILYSVFVSVLLSKSLQGAVSESDKNLVFSNEQISNLNIKLDKSNLIVNSNNTDSSTLISEDKVNNIIVKIKPKVSSQYGGVINSGIFSDPNEAARYFLGEKADKDALYQSLLSTITLQNDYSKSLFGNNSGLTTYGSIEVSIEKKVQNMTFGGEIVLDGSLSQDKTINAKTSFIYWKNQNFTVQLGGLKGIQSELAICGEKLNPVNGINGDLKEYTNYFALASSKHFVKGEEQTKVLVMNNAFLSKAALPTVNNNPDSNKINIYYKNSGLTIGATFIPDSQIKGSLPTLTKIKDGGYRNIIALGAKYSFKANDNLNFDMSVIGEYGFARQYVFANFKSFAAGVNYLNVNVENLKALQFGIQSTFNNLLSLAVGAGYYFNTGSYINSELVSSNIGSPEVKPYGVGGDKDIAPASANAYFVSVGFGYDDKVNSAGISYFISKQSGSIAQQVYQIISGVKNDQLKSNTTNAISLGYKRQMLNNYLNVSFGIMKSFYEFSGEEQQNIFTEGETKTLISKTVSNHPLTMFGAIEMKI